MKLVTKAMVSVDGDQSKFVSAENDSHFSGLCVGANPLAYMRIESIKAPSKASVINSCINQKKEQLTRCVYGTLHWFSSSLQKVDVQKNLL